MFRVVTFFVKLGKIFDSHIVLVEKILVSMVLELAVVVLY